MNLRPVIIHYHFFKNAGTSVDHVLKQAFPNTWYQLEADEQGPITAERIITHFREHPELRVLSSHTARLSLPVADDMRIFPIVFLRHPLDRVLSVYQFERKQTEDTEGSLQARKLDLPDFVAWRLGRKNDFSFRNFQSHRLAGLAPQDNQLSLNAKACQGLQKLAFVGLVEAFDASISVLQTWLQSSFPEVKFATVKLNVTQSSDSTLADRLAYLKTALGTDLYLKLLQENESDSVIYQHVANMYKNRTL